ncbi:Hpt domain-containing protein [Gemmata sp. JC673]|uniref:Hpt domain-containing protein n=1 Tax=Gemmata algarum TaxID=2975278 RepID=A0ABU5EVL5_9BACT|nr:Hpt domain-containing protein [Gemmata algarum]MDY3559284.1 Hpt domain-containing protein [Gemmata algarum]
MPTESDQLLATFLDEADENLAALESGLLSVNDGAADAEVLNAVFRAAHSIKGGSGLFGFDAITRLTHALEQLLDRIRKGQLPVTRDRIDLLFRAVDGLNVLFAATRGGGAPRAPDELIAALNAAAGAGPAAAPLSPRTAGPESGTFRVTFVPGPLLLTDGPDPLLLLRNLAKRGTVRSVAVDTRRVPEIDALDPAQSYLEWVVVLDTQQPRSELEQVFAFVDAGSSLGITACDAHPAAASGAAGDGSRCAAPQALLDYEAALGQLLNWVTTHLPTALAELEGT